jgi:hypothetical protein
MLQLFALTEVYARKELGKTYVDDAGKVFNNKQVCQDMPESQTQLHTPA